LRSKNLFGGVEATEIELRIRTESEGFGDLFMTIRKGGAGAIVAIDERGPGGVHTVKQPSEGRQEHGVRMTLEPQLRMSERKCLAHPDRTVGGICEPVVDLVVHDK
jgi:hypothetical protein